VSHPSLGEPPQLFPVIEGLHSFYTMRGELPVVVTWDRRTDDRRDEDDTTGAKRNRRQTDRRRKPPFTWDVADFVVVEPAKPRKASRKKTTRK